MDTESNIRLKSLTERIAAARKLDRQEYEQKEMGKRGNLRAGNTGIMSETGEIAGGCHRVAHLRQLGIELDPPDAGALLMFELGYANEDRIYSDLNRTLSGGEIIRREEEIPIEWATSNGTKVSGRPDLVLLDTFGADMPNRPKLLVEIKSVHSVWVARDVLFSGKPKLENVLQTAHYAWKLGTPGKLIYRQYSQQSIPKFGFNPPKQGERFSEHVEYNEKGGAKHVKQFEVIYDIGIDPTTGVISYSREGEAPLPTFAKTSDVQRYFEFVSNMATTQNLGPELMLLDISGEEKGYKHTDYCQACNIAKAVGGNYGEFISAAKAVNEVHKLKSSGRSTR